MISTPTVQGSQSLAILPDWVSRSQPTRLSVTTLTYHLVVCLVGTGSAVLVDQTTDGSIRFATTPATYPRRYGDQPFFMAMAQEWRNGPRRLREHDDDDDDDDVQGCLLTFVVNFLASFLVLIAVCQSFYYRCDDNDDVIVMVTDTTWHVVTHTCMSTWTRCCTHSHTWPWWPLPTHQSCSSEVPQPFYLFVACQNFTKWK